MSLQTVLDNLPEFCNDEILKSFIKGYSIVNNHGYKNIVCSISGGSDSDIVLDIIHRIDESKKVRYVWFDTGLEYKATKDHLDYLEDRYDIKFERERAIKPIPLCCKEYGQPFLSKLASEQISRLQKHDFTWEDKPYEELVKSYPECASAIKWWCNEYTRINSFDTFSMYDIGRNQWLKEFLIANPPTFKISSQCCTWAKKKVAKKIKCDLSIIGVRKAEGGIRAIAYKNCYTSGEEKTDSYRPVFWFTNEDKQDYEKAFNIVHSDCYTKYGFKRTGCSCCPYGRELEDELAEIKIHEPLMYKAVNTVFKDSYEYTRKYKQFCKKMNAEKEGQISIYNYL